MHFSILKSEAYLSLAGVGAILTVTIAAAIITSALTGVALLKANRHGDQARTGIAWFKASGALGTLWLVTAIVSPITEYFLRRSCPSSVDSPAFNFGMEQLPIFTNLLMYAAFSTFQVVQVEFAIGLRRISILSRERKVSGFFDEVSPVPHIIGLVSYAGVLILNLGALACSELYYSGVEAAFWPMKMTGLSLDAALWIFSIGNLINTACHRYAARQKRLWRLLMAVNIVSVFHHGALAVLAGFYGVTLAQDNAAYLCAYIAYAQLILSSWMLVACLSIGYVIAVMGYRQRGLWTKAPHTSLEEAKLGYGG